MRPMFVGHRRVLLLNDSCVLHVLWSACRYFGFLAENDVWQYATMKEPHIIHKIPCSWDIILYGGGPGLYSGASSRSNRAFNTAIDCQPARLRAHRPLFCGSRLTVGDTLCGWQRVGAAAHPFG